MASARNSLKGRLAPSPEVLRVLPHIHAVMSENAVFLRARAKRVESEVSWLLSDAIDRVASTAPEQRSVETYLKTAGIAFNVHILIPSSYAIYLELFTGNVPSCFTHLRLLLEGLVKCHAADKRFPRVRSFERRLDRLEKSAWNVSKLMRDVGSTGQLSPGFLRRDRASAGRKRSLR
jgi:hypothetical protein